MNGAKISPKTLDGGNDIDTLCLRAVHALMKDGASRKKPSPRDIRAQKRAKLNDVSDETKLSNLGDPFKMVMAPPLQIRVTRLHVQAHRSVSNARYFNGNLAGSSGNLARETRC
jgi:hypothetical protein